MGLFDEAADVLVNLPEQIQRLFHETEGMEAREFDVSGIGVGDDRVDTEESDGESDRESSDDDSDSVQNYYIPQGDEERKVNQLSRDFFRSKLVEHFDIVQ